MSSKKTNSHILRFLIAFSCLTIGLSLCQEPMNNSKEALQTNGKPIDLFTFLKEEGSKENAALGHFPNYRFNITNTSINIIPYSYKLTELSGEPSYRLGLQSNNINDEDYFIVDVWVIGAGDVNSSNINIRIPPQLADGPVDVIYKDFYLNISMNPDNKTFSYSVNPMLVLIKYNETNIGRKIPVINFYPRSYKNELNFMNYGATVVNESDIQKGLPTYPANWSYKLPDSDSKRFYLYKIIFKVNNSAPSGDYSIKFDLFYKWGGKWYVDSQLLPLHINYIYEKPIIQTLIVILAFIGLLCQIEGVLSRHQARVARILEKTRSIYEKIF